MKIFLIGFMGCGKSYNGKRLAAELNMDFIDLDRYIEESEGQSISEIFATKKEKAFRVMERDYLKSLKEKDNLVISCGGGTPCFYNNINWMNKNGTTIYLKSSVSLLAKRLSWGKAKRPLLSDLSDNQLKTFVKNKLAERADKYEAADHQIYQRIGDERNLEKLLEIVS